MQISKSVTTFHTCRRTFIVCFIRNRRVLELYIAPFGWTEQLTRVNSGTVTEDKNNFESKIPVAFCQIREYYKQDSGAVRTPDKIFVNNGSGSVRLEMKIVKS